MKPVKMNLELCTDCVEGAILAGKYGFRRIELCSALSEGGLTPSFGMIQSCSEVSSIEVHAMIRSRGGSFSCEDSELDIFQRDIQAAADAGARGVVFGILDTGDQISQKNLILVKMAESLGLQTTFHRAFDQVRDPMKSLKRIVEMGFDRLLTSGLKQRAIDGLDLLEAMHQEFGDKIEIMAGSGVDAENAPKLAGTGISNLHFTARKKSDEDLISGMGVRMVTDESKIRAISNLFRQ